MMHAESVAAAARDRADEHSAWAAVADWVMTLDPRRLAARHLVLSGLLVAFGLVAGLLLRFELMTPALDRLNPRAFGALLSLHGTLMMYFVALPLFPGVIGHTHLLRALGRDQMAFPRMGRLSWHLLATGGALVLGVFLLGGTEVGWMFDAQFGGHFLARGSLAMAIGVLLAAGALVAMALNTIVTIWISRRGDILAGQGPLVAAMLVGCSLMLAICPPLVVCMVMVVADQVAGLSLFGANVGADPRLYVAIFRGFSAPALYMMLIFAVGAAWSVLAARLSSPPRGRALVPAFMMMGVAGIFAGIAPVFKTLGAIPAFAASALIAALVLPAIGLVFAAAVHALRRGVRELDAALAFALGFFVLVSLAVVTMFVMALPLSGEYLESTTFATGHLHLVLTTALGMAFLASLYDLQPPAATRPARDMGGRFAAIVILAGTLASFLPPLILGARGASFRANAYPPEFQVLQLLASAGSTILVAGLILALANLRHGLRAASRA